MGALACSVKRVSPGKRAAIAILQNCVTEGSLIATQKGEHMSRYLKLVFCLILACGGLVGADQLMAAGAKPIHKCSCSCSVDGKVYKQEVTCPTDKCKDDCKCTNPTSPTGAACG